MSCPARLYPLRKPKNHRLPIPKWKLTVPSSASHVHTAYIGIQQRSDERAAVQARAQATAAVQDWLRTDDGPLASESFTLINGNDVQNAPVWVCYWFGGARFNRSVQSLSLPDVYSKLGVTGRASIGMWRESFTTPFSRLETSYSGLDYLPGLARIAGTGTEEHTCSAYWGSARDRIPDSAHDLFPPPADTTPINPVPRSIGQYLVGTNYQNLVHIRSGQFWQNCGQEEADAYEKKLEPTLEAGLEYLWGNPAESGARGLRYLRNGDGHGRRETCGAGFFASLESLETWAKSHPSHLAIYRGAMAHFKAFGDARDLRTWHEVSVLEEADARFEYINCTPNTGVVSTLPLEVRIDDLD